MDGLGYSRTVPELWCTGYLDTGVHRLCMQDGLGYSWTVPVTLVHGICQIWTELGIPEL